MQRDLDKADWAVGLMQARQSVRNYKDEPIPEEILYEVLAAGSTVPPAGICSPIPSLLRKTA